ncbi:M20/M25/M40 family metallo-hydrolase [Chondrinema litorale]|uniref:M20/M25/M40 family metallo-hydrolase n=1 Tax=Chondrinema litorale TaxID=2994555 RepID=UPI002543C903|nr:M20/M25/M40 family metallo-hydrolase [Chondrinema litorale]UZR93942.1 M28 family peptidase [Chondrinema litorale]
MKKLNTSIILAICSVILAIRPAQSQNTQSAELAVKALEVLSADDMEGRKSGTEGNAKARTYLIEEFSKLGFEVKTDTFSFRSTLEPVQGVNLLIEIKGQKYPESYIVISAHYDHLGIKNDDIYNGTDDNASGSAALLAIASELKNKKTKHSIIIAAFDAEEMGLQGAKHFVKHPMVDQEIIALNINMDMVSQSEKDELYACGTYHFPFLKEPIENTAKHHSDIKVLFGHDLPNTGHNDWTGQSDHYPFYKAEIPFVYFGVEDHPYYHKSTDTFDKLTKAFYMNAVEFISAFVFDIDEKFKLKLNN